MKKFILSIILGLSIQSFANSSTSLTGEEAKKYKEAALVALGRNIRCMINNREGWIFDDLIRTADAVSVQMNGQQPLLEFYKRGEFQKNGFDYISTLLTTDASFKKIENVKVLIYRLGKVNDGDLLNPRIREGYVLLHTCELKIN